MRRIVSVLIMLACLFSSVSIQAAEQDGISAVLVLDTSGSMRGTDKSRVAIEAVKLFIDMMEDRQVVGPPDGSRPRQVLISAEDLENLKSSTSDM